MRDVLESIRDFFERDWTPAEKVLLGVVKGFCLAPIKRGISCGNNNGNSYMQTEDGYWSEAEE